MPLNQNQFEESLNGLFEPAGDWNDPTLLASSATAFQNLSMHFIETRSRWLFDYVAFDPIKMGLMLKRFYRDAYGINRFNNFLGKMVSEKKLSTASKTEIEKELKSLSIRINSKAPRKTRIAAAFSLWASTMRPMSVLELPQTNDSRLWRLESTINFWMATSFLQKFGTVQIGGPEDHEDTKIRLNRVWYDFTFRDINLSSLEMLYASIFRPSIPPNTEEK